MSIILKNEATKVPQNLHKCISFFMFAPFWTTERKWLGKLRKFVWGLGACSPRKFKNWNSTFHILLKIPPVKKINFEKVNKPRTIRITETFFNFYSMALATENIHHTLTPCSLSNYSLNCPEQKTALRFSHVPKNLRVFSLNYFNTQQRVRGKRLTMFPRAKRNKIYWKTRKFPLGGKEEGYKARLATSTR